MIQIVIRDIPPSNNRFIGRNARFTYQKEKKKWLEMITSAIELIPRKPYSRSEVHLHYIFPTKHRRDPDNYSGKFILDALVQNRIIEDDSFFNINLHLSAEVRPKTKLTIIEVTPIA